MIALLNQIELHPIQCLPRFGVCSPLIEEPGSTQVMPDKAPYDSCHKRVTLAMPFEIRAHDNGTASHSTGAEQSLCILRFETAKLLASNPRNRLPRIVKKCARYEPRRQQKFRRCRSCQTTEQRRILRSYAVGGVSVHPLVPPTVSVLLSQQTRFI